MFDNVFSNKIVAFIVTPIITGIMAWFIPWAEEHLPGTPDLDDNAITALAIAGAAGGILIGLKFLHELAAWQKLKQFGSTDANLEDLEDIDLEDELGPIDNLSDVPVDTEVPADVGDAGKP